MSAAVSSDYRAVIGLETHVQLQTESKMFCGCGADYAGDEPNTHVCEVCLGMPGVLPVINRKAVDLTILTGLALNCRIPENAKFDRKNYAYPDLMKWYQISQYDLPLCEAGHLDVVTSGRKDRIGVTRVHLEEDTAKLSHVTGSDGSPASLIDVNRSGSCLMEIVSEPDITSSAQAMAYGAKIRDLLRWIGVSTANMQDGELRIDANVSVWRQGEATGDVKVEVKNMNSFRALGRALDFEIDRQSRAREAGQAIVQETRGWDEDSGLTVPQRTKEYAHDYRYFPEPDLPPLLIPEARVSGLRLRLPRMPDQVAADLVAEGCPAGDVEELVQDRVLTEFALSVVGEGVMAKDAVTWIVHELRRVLNDRDVPSGQIPLQATEVASLLVMRGDGVVSSTMASEVLDEMIATGASAAELVASRGPQISGEEELLAVARDVIGENPQAVEDYRAGKARAVQFLMGQVMRVTKGKANPGVVSELIRRQLDGVE
ncbi:MAG TPA: Asp-tRNA(Asn)/Glu-tRNA(Gln) amidotransferase GatCAB subunit B [Chloroflexi bacterium]|nr:Asp-tRNA(Asn)/Glu-tRNA(Gln) amidotransferase GatCAB subunit B [Chloroflexota bacterium]